MVTSGGTSFVSPFSFLCQTGLSVATRSLVFAIILLTSSQSLSVSTGWAQEKGQTATPKYGGTYRRPLSNNPSTLDPALINDIYSVGVSQQIFDGLVQYDGSLTIVPSIAES